MADFKELYQQLSSNVNFTDPIVRHDPTVEKSPVVKFNASEKIKAAGGGFTTSAIESKNLEGPKIPIIRIDNKVISRSSIGYVYIDYTRFWPTSKIVILQQNKSEELMEVAGMNSNMTIVMTPSVDGAYKPISIDFSIYNVEYHHDCIIYYGRYRMLKLQQKTTKQITFNPYPNVGCAAKYCSLGPNKHPTTYEFLHYLAVSECGLGFAATDNVKEIKDDKTRLVRNETFAEAIQKHVAFGGLDKDSVFDCWIDLYRYLVVVNFSWLMTTKVSPNDLGIKPVVGLTFDTDLIKPDEQRGMVHRVISNNKNFPENGDFEIASWKWEVNNSELFKNGTVNQYMVGNPSSVGSGNNSIESNMISIQGTSDTDSVTYGYKFGTSNWSGYEYGDVEDGNTPVLNQKNIHDNMLRKFKSKRLIVTMARPNFGLQRGTLVNVAIFEYSELGKRQIWQNWMNLTGDKTASAMKSDIQMEKTFSDTSTGLPNMAVTGMYYIDGMSFEYDIENPSRMVTQRLYLIKKDGMLNYLNANSLAKSYMVN